MEPLFERRFFFDSYAYRRRKGTHRAVHRAQYYMRRHEFYLKTDFVQFFPCVDHEILQTLLARIIADRQFLELVASVLASGLTITVVGEACRTSGELCCAP